MYMQKLTGLFLLALLAGCSDGGANTVAVDPAEETGECSANGQKQFVLDNLYAWYLWNDLLPPDIDIANYASPEELIIRVTEEFGPQKLVEGQEVPIDRFSFVRSQQSEQDFLDGTLGELFGFSYRFVDEAATDFRIVRVYSGSPAQVGGLARGQRILTLNRRSVTEIAGNEGISAFFSDNRTVEFEIERVGDNEFTTITKAVITIDPVAQWRLIDRGDGIPPVGYMQLDTFIDTANPRFEEAFAAFRDAGVTDVILDLRYNGGGLVRTAELLGDYLGAGVAPGEVFSRTEFNADRAAQNNEMSNFTNLQAFRDQTVNLSRLVVVATRGTASASELVTNGMIPYVDVTIVGDNTFGKPVGQIGLPFCDKIMRPTSFRIANADGDGDYFDGLPVDCAAPDDISKEIGADDDPNVVAAMSVLNTGACPAVATAEGQFAPQFRPVYQQPDRRGTPAREYLDAY
jgi:C-terminal processing protease CtpA/Prc